MQSHNNISDPDAITPVQKCGRHYWTKRDDYFAVGDQRGGKVRTCLSIVKDAGGQGKVTGLVTAGSRSSPQVNIVATIAQQLQIPCRVHTPTGKLGTQVQSAQEKGAVVIQHRAGYNTVLIARCREDAKNTGYLEIPFGMACLAAVEQTRAQVRNLPFGKFKRIVVSVGSGMTLAGILWGLIDQGHPDDVPVLGVIVGANPEKRLNQYAPENWRAMVTLVQSPLDYKKEVEDHVWNGIDLDPIYEAKCIPYVEKKDLLWITGHR